MSNIFRRLVATGLKHNAVPIGECYCTSSRDEEVNIEVAKSIKAIKNVEANQGFLRAFCRHTITAWTLLQNHEEIKRIWMETK